MIRFISGILAAVGESEVIVENGGIGYAVNVPGSLVSELPKVGSEIKLYTYFAVREDAIQLFGFLSYDDLTMFKLLITVNGIGPRAALGVLGTMSAQEISYAVLSEDTKKIAKSPGIGAKTAKKIILELKDKLEASGFLNNIEPTGEDTASEISSGVVSDAVEALVVLGYSKSDALRAVHAVEITEEMTVEEVLKHSLRNIM